MKTTSIKPWSLALTAWLALILLGLVYSPTRAQTNSMQRPLPRLDTKRGLYIRADGTRVYKDPLPPQKRVFTYRRRDGKVVSTVTGVRRPYVGKKHVAKRSNRKRPSTRRR